VDENIKKWQGFALGVSPTLVILGLSVGTPPGAVWAFFGTLIYLVAGSIAAAVIHRKTAEETTGSNPVIIGIFTGIFASAILTVVLCF